MHIYREIREGHTRRVAKLAIYTYRVRAAATAAPSVCLYVYVHICVRKRQAIGVREANVFWACSGK